MQHACVQCHTNFEITTNDLEFYERVSPVFVGTKIQIPPPTRCPDCRQRRRMTFRNQIHVYVRPSATTQQTIFSMFDRATHVRPVADNEWWGDDWNPVDFGMTYDPQKSFLEQYYSLQKKVPHFARSVKNEENSDYSNNGYYIKNCYFVFHSFKAEDCMYCEKAHTSRDCTDCTYAIGCELCYDSTWCHGCYNVQSSDFCDHCSDSFFLKNCVSCSDCFGCVNLQHKKFCVFNEQKTQQEYEAFLGQCALDTFSGRSDIAQRCATHALQFPVPHIIASQTENVTGNCLQECKDVQQSYFITRGEGHRYCFSLAGSKDCYDVTTYGDGCELLYECTVCGENSQRLVCCYECFDGASDLFYCSLCVGCNDCFGCISLRKKRYCILNKQYSKEEYEKLVPVIIETMRVRGEWGEYFPEHMSPIAYNHSVAQRYYPKTKHEAEASGMRWLEEVIPEAEQAIDAVTLPDALPLADDSLIVQSMLSKRPFKITSQEIKRYRRLRVPLPRKTYDERMEERIKKLGGIHLFDRTCTKCHKSIATTYAPDRPEIVYCEDCFLRGVY